MRRRTVRRILTPSERATLKAQEAELRAQLETPTFVMGPSGPVRVADRHGLNEPYRVEAELRKTRRIIDEGSPEDMSKYEIRSREKSIKILEERIRKRMVPEAQFKMRPDGGSEYHKVVGELVSQGQDKSLAADIEALKNLRRERDPDNPLAGSIEDLRKP